MKEPNLHIEYLDPNDLKPYKKNTRKHTQRDIDEIIKSIKECGFNDPIGIWGKENIVVEGHGRLEAAKELGIESVPCIRLDHMTNTERRQYAIKHNRTAELSEWDFKTLEEEVKELEEEGLDLSSLDFDFGSEIDWDNVNEINKGNYEKPESDKLRCPICGGIDEKIRFVKV